MKKFGVGVGHEAGLQCTERGISSHGENIGLFLNREEERMHVSFQALGFERLTGQKTGWHQVAMDRKVLREEVKENGRQLSGPGGGGGWMHRDARDRS